MASFTKGPWAVMRDGPKGDGEPWAAFMEAAPGLTIASPHNTEPICRVSGYVQPVKANACLIIAAPEMYDVIRAMLDCSASLDAIVVARTRAHALLARIDGE